MVNENGTETNVTNMTSDTSNEIKRIPGIGILLAFLAGIAFATASLSIKMITSVSGVEIAAVRCLVMAIFFMIFILSKRLSLKPVKGEMVALLSRSFIGALGLTLACSAIKLIPLGDSYALFAASPAFVTIFACILFKEPCGLVQVGCIILAFSGIVLISKPSFIFPQDGYDLYARTRTIGTIFALCTAIATAAALVSMRALRTTPTPVVIVWYACTTTIITTGYCLIRGELAFPSSNGEYGWLFLGGAAASIGQWLLTIALKLADAGSISLAGTSEILMAFIFQATILHGAIPWTSVVGAAILSLGVIAIAVDNWYKSDPNGFKKVVFCRHSDVKEVEPALKIPETRIRTFSTMSFN